MIISDLNYLEATEGSAVVGGIKNDFQKQVLIFKENLNIKKDVDVDVKVKNNFAFAEGDADAYGKNTFVQVINSTKTVEGYYSGASSTSISGSAK